MMKTGDTFTEENRIFRVTGTDGAGRITSECIGFVGDDVKNVKSGADADVTKEVKEEEKKEEKKTSAKRNSAKKTPADTSEKNNDCDASADTAEEKKTEETTEK